MVTTRNGQVHMRFGTLLRILTLVLQICEISSSSSNNGTLSTTFYTMLHSQTINYSFFGEGMAFDTKRDRYLLGSLQLGTLLAMPRSSLPDKNIYYDEVDLTFILSSRPASFNGSNFLGLEMNPVDDDEVWGCVGYGPWSTYGVARVNLSSSAVIFYDLGNMANAATGNHAVFNDLAFSSAGDFVFITDTWGYQVLRMDVASGEVMIWSNGSMLCSQCLSTEAHFDGPNGIVYVSPLSLDSCNGERPTDGSTVEDFLIVVLGSSSRRLLRINASAPLQEPQEIRLLFNLSVSGITDMDGIALSSDHSTLFVVGNGVNSLFALTSDDGWASATVRAVYNANCPKYQPSAVVLINGKDAVCYCTNGFGAGPYPLSQLSDIGDKVAFEKRSLLLSAFDMRPEGIAYDGGLRDRVILGSISTGAVLGVPRPSSPGVELSLSDLYTYFKGGGSVPVTSVKGLQVDPDDGCRLWMAVDGAPIGIALLDICSMHSADEVSAFINLTDYAHPDVGSSPNDITIVEGVLFVTDLSGGYVWRVQLIGEDPTTASVTVFLHFEPSDRPNGIENIDGSLLVSLSGSNRLMRADVSGEGTAFEVIISPAGTLRSADGLVFDAAQEVLYAALHNDNAVLALTSCDEWKTATVAVSFLAHCLSSTSSEEVTTVAVAGDELWVLCSDGFGVGPYGLNRVLNASAGQVFSGPSACGDDVDEGDEKSSSPTSARDDDDKVSVVYLWTTVGLAIALSLLFVVAYIRITEGKNSDENLL